MVMLLIFEAVAYWHARNVFDEAAAEGARVAAAYGSTCAEGIAAATEMVHLHAGSWAAGVLVSCTEGDTVQVVVAGRTPGVLGESIGIRAQAGRPPRRRGDPWPGVTTTVWPPLWR